MLLAKKIVFLSKILKWICRGGIALFLVLPTLYWLFGISHLHLRFSNLPLIDIRPLSTQMRLVGLSIDLIPSLFFVFILILLTRLFKQYESLCFSSKKNIRHIRQIAFILLCNFVTYPFYLALRTSLFMPEQTYIFQFFGPNDFKEILVLFSLLLISYLTEVALVLEEDLIGII